MLMNLFSIFDPVTGWMSFNWSCVGLLILVIPFNFWGSKGRLFMYFKGLLSFVGSDLSSVLSKSMLKGVAIFLTYFLFVMSMNLFGLVSYVFTGTSHLVMNLSISLPIWGSLVCFGWFTKSEEMFSHLVPEGTPMVLSSFMVVIETVSNLIRPLTLSVRLAANMIAGHLILSLISGVVEVNLSLFFIVSWVMVVLLVLEVSVALIQSYVFVVLVSLYSSEVN